MTPETQKTQINGIDNDPALRALLAKRMGAALTQLAVRPLRAEAVFVDDNGPKGGPRSAAPSRSACRAGRTSAWSGARRRRGWLSTRPLPS